MEIGRMDTTVDLAARSSGGSGGGPGAPAPAQGTTASEDALRELVHRIVQEELQRILREGG
ncbi:MAG TPA: hypothetical protein PKA64_05545 [Myxococcota bacterium]|nr:hypothetical protein [Myxococcota bacterium]